MQQFISRFQDRIQGVLSGFDRLRFRGTLRRLSYGRGMELYLRVNQILFKDYQQFMKRLSQNLKDASSARFREQNLPVRFLARGDADKDELARQIAAERGITSGDVCLLSGMELVRSFQHEGTHMIMRKRPCQTLYHYLIDPGFGWMYASIQTWFPFAVHICINGREWLARQMDTAGLQCVRQDNCFPWIEDYARAQELMDEQLKTAWKERLAPFALRLNPLHREIFARFDAEYYWSVNQCEWATDIGFKPGALDRLSPRFLEHGMLNLHSADLMRFLGKRLTPTGKIPARFAGQITTDLKRPPTGDRIKHRINGNSLKGYGKAALPVGDLFRVETTTNQIDDLRAYRPKQGGPEDDLKWRPLRYGVADLHRRAEISQKANERYLNALSDIDDSTRISELVRILEKPRGTGRQRARALHPFAAQDHALLEAVSRGEFLLNGLRNRDLRALLYKPGPVTVTEKKRRSAAVGRQLRLLRTHGIIRKIPNTHRYQVTPAGRIALTAVLSVDRASIAQLSRFAA